MSVIATILAYAGLAIVSTVVVWKGSELLESSTEKLSGYYQLPPLVQGSIVLAVGSSFPELSTAVLSAALHGDFELGVAAVVGSALFNILMIPALAGLWAEERLESTRDLIYKETQFYLISIVVLLLMFSFAVIYNPLAGGTDAQVGGVTRGLALLPLALYAVYVYLQYQDTRDHQPEAPPEDIHLPKQGTRLVGSLLIILIGVEGLIRSAVAFGDIFGTPSFLWGITVVAAGTSVPDAFVSIRASRAGNPVTSVANVLGSNIFDLLVCIPAAALVAGTVAINYSVGMPMMGVLSLATLIVLLTMRSEMVLTTPEAWGLIALYLAFVVWMGAETVGTVDLIPHLPPPAHTP
ncbi:cation:H+ antiporter [Salinibacter ruber]|jgi:cation:H+ antiporter|uniref:Na+/Ca2+-exchanging protein n=3 Tax=Salinibacter ruber TaxID=146919 RepID=Q2S1K1_SALRD|nr:sodium:calcium antiporter [Salinibacter ruber]ABC43995.1 Na+/Ca2+-exchanging protein [Salinibacter ruber DSM 13855]MBB4059973.1 cation:H+ antiporter [Salinibacter ruber]MBB4069789.1 cation:H+ antiporter [Salinibacter ruber]MCS3612029.1 cation:H+ antiporter [Salinibacter ruber]MCS3615674.1 cation:H+ antiporter [Salinibacter ruber]